MSHQGQKSHDLVFKTFQNSLEEKINNVLNFFYILQGLLTRLAQSAEGANALLNTGVMSRLSECRFIDLRPSGPASHFHTHRHSSHSPDRMMTTMTSSGDIFVPSIMERYQQLLIPALRMSLSLLTSLGQEHHDASVQVNH
jgi:nuclear pore complex protein Nup205